MDYLEELSNKLGGKIKFQDILNSNFKEKCFRRIIIKNYEGCKIEIMEYGNILQMCIKVKYNFSFFAFAINNIEKISFLNKEIEIINFPYKVFISKLNYPILKSDLPFFWEDFSLKVKNLKLLPEESIFIYSNGLSIALNSKRNVIPVLDDIIDLLNSNDSSFVNNTQERIFKKNIPENLRPLIPLLKKWSISDDSEREQLMEETSEKQKNKLVKTVYPQIIEINQFLDSFGDEPPSHEAILFGNLAKLISELQVTES